MINYELMESLAPRHLQARPSAHPASWHVQGGTPLFARQELAMHIATQVPVAFKGL
jgi:hypothetical protein